ncbi:Protein of unknown function (DUF2637) (plasmid) [Mycobacterium sp. JS623]|uniref:DUF2637 domain-containing protein n=1 Tax=Mycobacterium sp. JS623 TaxID=212767 RepID=UPI0002A5536F|nr:DUF2637 domain-containing protein [Mycobacterium sp. JS623]AGB26815.1 Protein of unknown function (DUF2637) [Mycobacterium sp. JS623]
MDRTPADATVVGSSLPGVVRFYWGWLVFATSVSVLGNITHALLVAPSPLRMLAAVASVVPPAFVLGSTHSVALSLRMRRFAPIYVLGLLMTMGVAACAFFLSFDALRGLAVILGWSPGRAWLFPLAIDVSIAQATFGLLALAPPAATSPLMRAVAADDRSTVSRAPASEGPEHLSPDDARHAAAGQEAGPSFSVAESEDIVEWTPTAQQLVRNGTTSKDPEIVAAILAEHAAGTPPGTISRRSGVHHSTVGRILAGAAALTR